MPTKTLRVETVAQAYLELLRDRGIDCFFANAGTDFASIVDAFARFATEGKTTPRPIAVPHEFVAVSMAHGYYLVTGRPQAVMVHVTVGTANGSGAVINASRTQVPVLFTAGRTPITEDGGLPGARDTHIHWAQESFDQAGMLREYVKWDYELRHPVQLEAVVDRALELAMAEPRGPVYLTLPREVLAQPLGELTISSPARRQVESRRFPDPARIEEAAERLVAARNPLIVTAELGRARAAVDGLVALADTGAFPVLESSPAYVNFPADHPCHAGWVFGSQDYPGMAEADVVLVIDCDVPWFPSRSRPADDATVIQLAVDPFYSRYPMRSYPCDVPLAAEPAVALPLLTEAVRRRVDPALVAARRARLGEAHRARRESWARAAQEERALAPIGFQWASRCVGEVLGSDTIVVNEYPLDLRHAPPIGNRAPPGSPHSGGLGWGLGAGSWREARCAGEDRHRHGRGRGLHLRGSDGRPPRVAAPQAAVPVGDLQQCRLGGGRARHALRASRRLGGHDRGIPPDRALLLRSLRGDRAELRRPRRARRGSGRAAGGTPPRAAGRPRRGPPGRPERRLAPSGRSPRGSGVPRRRDTALDEGHRTGRALGLLPSEIFTSLRFLSRVPAFLRRPFTDAEARAFVRERRSSREAAFLELVRGEPSTSKATADRTLLREAGCELGDLARLVHGEGIEGALREVGRAGGCT